MDYSPENTRSFGDAGALELTGKIMVVSIIILFLVIVFVFCLHLYAKVFWYRTSTTTTTRRRRRLDFTSAHHESIAAVRRGLDPSILSTLAVMEFDPKRFKDGLECAVCLSEVSEGEKTRILPKCSHGFHVECIDMWFQSHSTCPLCRNPVSNENQLDSVDESNGNGDVSSSFPTNVLVWGNADENHQSTTTSDIAEGPSSSLSVGSTSDEITVINIPRRIEEEEEEEKSPVVASRLKSFKRLLSGNRRVNPSSPRNSDLESQC